MSAIPVMLVGLGAIGSRVADECEAQEDFEVVAAVDPRRARERIAGVEVVASTLEATPGAQVALVCTASRLAAVRGDLEVLASAGLDVVSTCEELTLPSRANVQVAAALDARARQAGRTILACGVNPGLVMDVLPALVASASLRPRAVRARRCVDLDRRRPQLRAKLGVGRGPRQWRDAQARDGSFGHLGLVESAELLALGLGWELTATDFAREPLTRNGSVTGVRESVAAETGDRRRLELELVFDRGAEDVDEVWVEGDPPIDVVLRGGVQGDAATVARLLAGARVVQAMPPGLRLPIEAPLRAA